MQSRNESRVPWRVPLGVGLAIATVIAGSPPRAAQAAVCSAQCQTSSSCVFGGIQNVALGAARLSINEACHLVVSNLGPTGEDGFAQVSLPRGSGEVVTFFGCPNFVQSQAGARETMTVYADVPGGIYYRKTVENLGDNRLVIRPDYSSLGATRYGVTIFDGGRVAAQFSGLASAALQVNQGDQEEVN